MASRTLSAYRGGKEDHHRGILRPKMGKPHLRLAVRSESLARATELLSRFLPKLADKGFIFVPDPKDPSKVRTIFARTQTQVDWYIHEVIERYERELKPEEKDRAWIYGRWQYRGTGKLRISITEYGSPSVPGSWGDGARAQLESKLDDAARAFLVWAEVLHAAHLDREVQARRRAEEARLWEEEEAWRRGIEKMQTEFQEASDRWAKAESLRAFRGACEGALRARSADGILSDFERRWLEWADRVAASLDPLKGRYLNDALLAGRISELSPAQLALVRRSAISLNVALTELQAWIAKGASESAGNATAALLESLAAIVRHREAFPDPVAFRNWLKTPSSTFGNQSPGDWLALGKIKALAELVSGAKPSPAT